MLVSLPLMVPFFGGFKERPEGELFFFGGGLSLVVLQRNQQENCRLPFWAGELPSKKHEPQQVPTRASCCEVERGAAVAERQVDLREAGRVFPDLLHPAERTGLGGA